MNKILCKEAKQTLIVLLLVMLAAGCARTPYFQVLNASEETTVEPEEGFPVNFNVSVSIDYPEVKGDTTHVITALRHAIVLHAFGWDFDTLDVETAAKVYVERLTGDFKAFSEEMKSSGMYSEGSDPEIDEWYDSLTGYFAGSCKRFSSYVLEYSGYSGGGHPDAAATGIVFDLVDGVQVTLDEVIKPGSDKKLGELIRLHAAECVPEGTAGALYSPFLMPIGNFVITGQSITFIYNPGEIGPQGLGVVQISVPLKECRKAGVLAKGI